MKKLLCLLLAAVMVCGFAACGEEAPAKTTAPVTTAPEISDVLRVGFGRAEITPEESVMLHGYPGRETRWSQTVLDPLYATCIAISDAADNTIIVFHMDLTATWGDCAVWQRKAISDATGVPFKNIAVACTHNHSAPSMGFTDDERYPVMRRYADMVQQRMVEAATQAMADRAVCTMEYGAAYPEGLNFVRHYVMNDGSIVGDAFGSDTGKTYERHVHDADNQLQVVRFRREGKKDIIMANFQTHPHMCGGHLDGRVTSDLVGAMRSTMEQELDCQFLYFTGASGNVNPTSRIRRENTVTSHIDHGQKLAQHAMEALQNTRQIPGGSVQVLERDVAVYINKNALDIRLLVLSAGGLAFGAPPYEMFDTNGRFIKNKSPFDATFVLYLVNASNGYVAEEAAYAYGGYEVEYSGYAKGTAEVLADNFVDMLYALKEAENPNPVREAVPAQKA